MSTFNGLVAEFPDIRVDFFRSHPNLRPPLACFLSHIHSDHLAGLESLRAPFVYCSAATKEMLLRLERYPCRINYASGILEARVQRYRHLRNLLKPVPLDTPTVLELEPGNSLQVTLFDANHCPGAVMFLFEGRGKAVLYTGDIRSEPWFVNAITRSPSLIEYTSGLKTLDTIYLDTSFIDNLEFPTKAQGITELLRKVSRYPADTVFHFQAWTYGYEDVWIGLSKALGSKIHVDEYKMLMFRSLIATQSDDKFAPSSHLCPEAPSLVGFMCGNTHHPGCLTSDETVRLHSCEKGNYCDTVKNSRVVWIRPIITRLPDGRTVAEAGVGGGGDDLEREAELDYLSPEDVASLVEALCNADHVPEEIREQIAQFLLSAITTGRKVPLDLERTVFGDNNETNLRNGLEAIVGKLNMRKLSPANNSDDQSLPTVVTFPYSRHSSYPELCNLVNAFKPKDVWPCTVDLPSWLREGITIEHLFGEHCSGNTFQHDNLVRERFGDPRNIVSENMDSQATDSSVSEATRPSQLSPHSVESVHLTQPLPIITGSFLSQPVLDVVPEPSLAEDELHTPSQHHHSEMSQPVEPPNLGEFDPTSLCDSQASCLSELALDVRFHAFQAMLESARGTHGLEIGLFSTTDNHSKPDDELLCQSSALPAANALTLQSASHHTAGTMTTPHENGL